MLTRLGRVASRRPRLVLVVWAAVFVLGLAAGPALFSSMTSDMGGGAGSRVGTGLRAARRAAASGRAAAPTADPSSTPWSTERRSTTRSSAPACSMPWPTSSGCRASPTCSTPTATATRASGPTDGQASALVVRLRPHGLECRRSDRHGALEARGDRRPPGARRERGHGRRRDQRAGRAGPGPGRGPRPAGRLRRHGRGARRHPRRRPARAAVAGQRRRGPPRAAGASALGDVAVYSINVVTMFGIGLGIDYGLLVVGRFREERAAGRTIPEAIERTAATAGVTVAYSGLDGGRVAGRAAGVRQRRAPVARHRWHRRGAAGRAGRGHAAARPAGAGRPSHPAGPDHGRPRARFFARVGRRRATSCPARGRRHRGAAGPGGRPLRQRPLRAARRPLAAAVLDRAPARRDPP